jgi:hypothetical protein
MKTEPQTPQEARHHQEQGIQSSSQSENLSEVDEEA